MNVRVQVVKASQQRYDTLGDWLWDGKTLVVTVSRMGDWRYQALILMHELAEAMMCIADGVTQAQVDDWDFAKAEVEGEPGEMDGCPYAVQHERATTIEAVMAGWLGLDYVTYLRETRDGEDEVGDQDGDAPGEQASVPR